MIERPRHLVLVCVQDDGQAAGLLVHARHLAAALGSPWVVLCLDGAVSTGTASTGSGALEAALQAAHGAGAVIDRSRAITAAHPQATGETWVARVAAAAREHAATTLLTGPPPHRRRPSWPGQASPLVLLQQQLRRTLPAVSIHVFDESARTPAARSGRTPPWQGTLTALGALAVCTVIAWLLSPHLEPANLIMVYLAGVVHVALRTGRPVALLTVVASVALYDLLFIAPGGAQKPSEPHYLLVSVVMLLVGFIVSQLASRSRRQTAMAEARARRAQALNQLALELVKARSPASIAAALAQAVHHSLGASAHLLPIDGEGRLQTPAGDFPQQTRLAQTALLRRGETGAGTPIEPDAPYRCLPLLSADGPLGVVAVDLLARERDTPEDQQLLRASANQVAVALDRAVFEQRSARDAVQAEGERLRNTLLAGVSHDFRTPLTTIVGAATSLLEQDHAIDAEQRHALLRSVLAEARRMHATTSNLLDLTRLQEGAIRLNPEWCPADELVEEARAALGARLAAHRVTVNTPPEAVVWCDPRLVGQLLLNLLDNTTRHAPGAAIELSVGLGPAQWQLVVADDGPGVPAGQEHEVFKKFSRGSPDTAAHGGGTGLGLAICAAVARLHGGTLALAPGPGARFVLSLPQPTLDAHGLEEAG